MSCHQRKKARFKRVGSGGSVNPNQWHLQEDRGHQTQKARGKERAKASTSRPAHKSGGTSPEGARGWGIPTPPPGQFVDNPIKIGNLQQALVTNKISVQNCQWLGVRSRIHHWEKITSDSLLLSAITHGVRAPLHSLPNPNECTTRVCQPQPEIEKTIAEYVATQAIRPLDKETEQRTKYWVPIFGREKKQEVGGNHKVRLITDLRDLNECQDIQSHHPQTLKQILETLRDTTLLWGLTLDLKAYYHHLALHKTTQRWMRFWYQNQGFQIVGMPFGWTMSPFWAHRLALPVRKQLTEWGIPHSWRVDDVLILGRSQEETNLRATKLVNLLTSLGIQVNPDKSMHNASQIVTYLGHQIDLKHNKIRPIPQKTAQAYKLATKLANGQTLTPKKLASLAGTLLDLTKSNLRLLGTPPSLMQMAGRAAALIKSLFPTASLAKIWNTPIPKSRLPHLLRTLLQVKSALQSPCHPQLRPNSPLCCTLQTDASDKGWGATLISRNREIGTCAMRWTPNQAKMHITHREALASALATRHLMDRIPRNCQLRIQADATSTIRAWKKGS